MFYRWTPVRITVKELAAKCQVFYRKIYGFFLSAEGIEPGTASFPTKLNQHWSNVDPMFDIGSTLIDVDSTLCAKWVSTYPTELPDLNGPPLRFYA